MIAIGSDHAGVDLKEKVKQYLTDNNIEYKDFGTYTKDSVDYPDIAIEVAKEVASQKAEKGILICGTGIGMSIVANKVNGIRCALCHDENTARLSKQHNNANIIAVGARVLEDEVAIKIIDTWLNEQFEERHQKRLDKIKKYEGSKEQ